MLSTQSTKVLQRKEEWTLTQNAGQSTRQLTQAERLSKGKSGKHTIEDIVCEPCTRNFIVGSVGSGKSTLGCTVISTYHDLYPMHRIYVVDYKKRFFAKFDEESPLLFPRGLEATNHGSRRGVFINAKLENNPIRWSLPKGGTVVIQDEDSVSDLFEWLYDNQDINQPSLLYMDESFDVMSGTRANPNLRRLIQMGRELGIGTLIINQRPSWIDRTFITESDSIYYGKLNSKMDRIYVLDETGLRDYYGVQDIPVKAYEWWKIKQGQLEDSFFFTLTGVEGK